MDLDDLRGALDEAGTVPGVDVAAARDTVGTRSRRLRRRQRGLASGIALLVVVAVVVGTVIAFGSGSTHRSIDIAPPDGTVDGKVPSRYGAALAYDDARGEVVLFGGEDLNGSFDATFADTWLWDGHGWTQAHPVTTPPARRGAVMSYDPASKRVVLFGGARPRKNAATVALTDTWAWDGTTWTEQHPAHVPPWSGGTAMSYDPKSQSTLLLTLPSSHPNIEVTPDSVSLRGPAPFGTWRWDGSDWRELVTPKAPLYATARIAFHGNPRLTPLPNGAGLLFYSWSTYTGSCPAPRPNEKSACGVGSESRETWTWDGRGWSEQYPTNAPVAGQIVATPGPGTEPTLFTSNLTSSAAVWRWTGSDWRRTPYAGTAPDGEGLAVYDAHDSEIVAYVGRFGTDGAFYDTWTWNGSWTLRAAGKAPTTTTAAPTTTTTRRIPDPLPTGAAMLHVSGRTITVLDAKGNRVESLVTAFAGRTVINAHLMPDHRTIWYATHADDNRTCPEIVKLDLATNTRTVVAHAEDFALTADGSKLLLVYPYSNALVTSDCRPVQLLPASAYAADMIVRDLATGAQSILPSGGYPSAGSGGPSGHVWTSASGEKLIAATCVVEGCGTVMLDVPKNLDGPIVIDHKNAGPTCDCPMLVSGADGVYGTDEGNINTRRTSLRRYDATNLTGNGTVVTAPAGVTLGGSPAPTAAGVFVLGARSGAQRVLYRLDNGTLVPVGSVITAGSIYSIPPYVPPAH